MRCINCGNEFENEYCSHCGLSRKYNRVLYRYYENHPEQENQAVRHSSSIKCINCGMVFEHDNCPRCGLSYKNSRVLYRYEERQRENYHPQKKSKKRKKNLPLRIVGGVALAVVGLSLLIGVFGDPPDDGEEIEEVSGNDVVAEMDADLAGDIAGEEQAEQKEIESEETETFGAYTLTKTTFVNGAKRIEINVCEGNSVAISQYDGTSMAIYAGDGAALMEELLFYSGMILPYAKENDGIAGITTKDINGQEIMWTVMYQDGEIVASSGEMPEDRYAALTDNDLQELSAQDFESLTSEISLFLTGKPMESDLTSTSIVTREDIVAQATSATYQDLLRDPSLHKGEYIVLTVKLQQVLDDSGFLSSETYYFGYTDNSGYDLYFDDQYCFTDTRVDDSTKLLKDDILTVYGVFSGTGDFKRALGGTTVEIPMVEMLYVDIGAQDDETRISKSEFDSIENGMTYDEVVEIVGGEGELISEVDLGEYKIEMYSWQGEGSIGANAIIQFQDGKMETKTQTGLE